MGINFEKDIIFNVLRSVDLLISCDSFSGFKKMFHQDLPNSINSATSNYCAEFRVFLNAAIDSGLDKLSLKTLIKSGDSHDAFVIVDAHRSNCIDNIIVIVLFLSSHACSKPGCDGFSYMKCGKCRVAHYCNGDCQVNDWENHQKDCYTLKSQRRERKYIFKAFSDVLSASYQHKQFSHTVIKSTCKVIQAKMFQQNLQLLTSNNPICWKVKEICWKVKEEYLRISGRHLALNERTYLSLLSKYTSRT